MKKKNSFRALSLSDGVLSILSLSEVLQPFTVLVLLYLVFNEFLNEKELTLE